MHPKLRIVLLACIGSFLLGMNLVCLWACFNPWIDDKAYRCLVVLESSLIVFWGYTYITKKIENKS